MSNKMLIDASHPEETRVAVVRGNRIEDFDFESQEKKQLRGNIYLAKVTRVEPSLQAAFVDYGGNRHGFLAFSEIHPDYYQIPVADRQALLEAEAEEARAHKKAEDDADNESEVANAADEISEEAEAKVETSSTDDEDSASDTAAEEAPAETKKPRRKRVRRSKKAAENEGEAENTENADSDSEPAAATDTPEENASAVTEETSTVEEKPKPKRKYTRRKTAAKPKAAASDEAAPSDELQEDTAVAENSQDTNDGGDDDSTPTSMAAIVETDSISEDLPDESGGDDSDENAGEPAVSAFEQTDEPEEKPKPKRKTTRRKPAAKKTTKKDVEAEAIEAIEGADVPAEVAEAPDAAVAAADEDSASDENKEEAKPKKRSTRRRSTKAKKKEAEEAKSDSDDDKREDDISSESEAGELDADQNGDEVEQVGQEDALEEVPNPRRQRRHYKIQEVIKRRQVLLVQVVKEERGNKGAALTTYLSLAGRYSVLMPNTARGGGISRKITNAADRKRLKDVAEKLDVPQGMGVILRTAGAARTEQEINRDFEYLMRLWEQVRNLTLSSTAPCLVYEEGSLIKRSIRDLYDKDTGEIVVAGDQGFNEAKDFMGMLMPEHVKKVKQYRKNQALFAKFGVESQLERMMSPQVTLKSGGYLVINQTEALVAVDVNSGRSTREHSIEDTALQTNLEAAEEVARQLRLRDLAGLIVIDFIDMEEKKNNRSVEKKLKECLKSDRARIQVGRISHFGLLEMSRQRMRSSVLESTMDVCEHCSGLGYIRSDSAIALHVFRAIEEHVSRHNKYDVVVKTTRSIAFHILNHKRAALLHLEQRYGLRVLIQGEANINGQEFTLEKGDMARGEPAQAAVGFQNNAAFEALDWEADKTESSDEDRKRKPRSRSNKSDDEATSDATESRAEDGEDGDQPRRKRRRGKRGGRRKSRQEHSDALELANDNEEQTSVESEEQNAEASTDTPQEALAVKEEITAQVADDEPKSEAAPSDTSADENLETEEKKTRSKRPGRVTQKAPIQKPEEKSESDVVTAEAVEPPRPARRRTSRRSAAAVADVENGAQPEPLATESQTSAAENSSDEEVVTTSSSVVEEVKEVDEKPAKKGWWSRGGGFF